MKTLRTLALLAPLMVAAGGCTGLLLGGGSHPKQAYNVPPGHLPPPGQCRVWYPALPPGRQSPPGNCDELAYRVPADAYLVYGR